MLLQDATAAVGAALPLPLPYRTVLVPLDGSSFGEHALPLALEVARRDGAKVLVAHVHPHPQMAYAADRFLHTDLYARLRRRRRQYLKGVVQRLAQASSVPVTSLLLEEGEVAASLCEMADAGADLVVMATHGRGPFARLWRGGVADALVQRLSVPILLVRGRDEPPDLADRPTIRQVLVPLDGSDYSGHVLEPVLGWKAFAGADYTLVHAFDPKWAPAGTPTGWPVPPWTPLPPEAASVRRAAERLRRRVARVQVVFLCDEDPPRAIVRFARSVGTDLIALTTRGRGELTRLLRGSVADRLIQSASLPVLVFRADRE